MFFIRFTSTKELTEKQLAQNMFYLLLIFFFLKQFKSHVAHFASNRTVH